MRTPLAVVEDNLSPGALSPRTLLVKCIDSMVQSPKVLSDAKTVFADRSSIPLGDLVRFNSSQLCQNTRREKLERMGEEILDLWQQLDIGKDEQVGSYEVSMWGDDSVNLMLRRLHVK